MSTSRPTISDKIKFQLVSRAAGRCEFPGCNKSLYEDELTKQAGNFSENAHIIAFSPRGPRGEGDKDGRPANVDTVDNLMLLCAEHHKLIDSSPERYPVGELLKYKLEHEERIALATEIQFEKKAYLVTYTAPIAQFIPSVAIDEARMAMFPEQYPASREVINLSLDATKAPSDSTSYEHAVEELHNKFYMSIRQKLKACDTTRFAVFAIAPMPLLIQLGSFLGDAVSAVIYQKQRDKGWKWDDSAPDRKFKITRPNKTAGKKPVLLMMLTDKIDVTRIHETLGEDVAIWTITADYQGYDFILKRHHLASFKAIARSVIDEVQKYYPKGEELHIFPIMPASACVEFGRIRTASHNPWVIYEKRRDSVNYVKTISI